MAGSVPGSKNKFHAFFYKNYNNGKNQTPYTLYEGYKYYNLKNGLHGYNFFL